MESAVIGVKKVSDFRKKPPPITKNCQEEVCKS